MNLSVAEPQLQTCPVCGSKHTSNEGCQFTTEEWNSKFPPGTAVLAFLGADDDPAMARTLTLAVNDQVHISTLTKRCQVWLDQLKPCVVAPAESPNDISAETSTPVNDQEADHLATVAADVGLKLRRDTVAAMTIADRRKVGGFLLSLRVDHDGRTGGLTTPACVVQAIAPPTWSVADCLLAWSLMPNTGYVKNWMCHVAEPPADDSHLLRIVRSCLAPNVMRTEQQLRFDDWGMIRWETDGLNRVATDSDCRVWIQKGKPTLRSEAEFKRSTTPPDLSGESLAATVRRVLLSRSEESAMPVTKTKPATKRKTVKRKAPLSADAPAKANGKSIRIDKAHGATSAAGASAPTMIEVETPLIAIRENDREDFDPKKLKQLAASIKRDGIIQPLVVTPDGDGYRLIAGERRLRAARLLRLKTVPVTIRRGDGTFGDVGAKEIALLRFQENEAREDLNAIERAAAIAGLVELHGSNKAVASLIGCNPSQVSNLVRLLELPEIWQQWVAAGKLAPTSVRPLIPYAGKRPQVLQWLVDKYASDIDEGEFELVEAKITDAVRACTRSLKLSEYYGFRPPAKDDCHFRYDSKKHADLDVEELDVGWNGNERRAWNIDAWDETNAKPLQARKEKHRAQKAKANTAKVKDPSGKKAAKEPPFNSHELDEALTYQMAATLAGHIAAPKHKNKLLAVALFLAPQEAGCRVDDVACAEAGKKEPQYKVRNREMAKLFSGDDAPKFAVAVLQQLLKHAEEFAELEGVAEILGVDIFPPDWQPTRDVLEAFSTDWLRAFGRDQLNLPLDEQPENPIEVMDWLEVDWPAGVVPAEIRKLCE